MISRAKMGNPVERIRPQESASCITRDRGFVAWNMGDMNVGHVELMIMNLHAQEQPH